MKPITSDAEEVVIHIFHGISASFRCRLDRKLSWKNLALATLQDDHHSRLDEPLEQTVGHKRLHAAKKMALGVMKGKREQLERKDRKALEQQNLRDAEKALEIPTVQLSFTF